MQWIHGGAWIMGSNGKYNGSWGGCKACDDSHFWDGCTRYPPTNQGGWMLSGRYQGIYLSPGAGDGASGNGWSFSTDEATTGSSYQEYSINDVSSEYLFYAYDCCPSEPWPVVLYTIDLERASAFYITLTLLPGMVVKSNARCRGGQTADEPW